MHGPVGSDQSRLDVSKDGVDPFEGRLFGGLRAAASLNLSVRASSRCDGGETRERIGDDVGAASKRRAREFANRHLSEADDAAKNDLIWLAVLGCCNGGDEGGFTRRTAPVFAGALATDIGVVHLHVAIETLGAVSLDHDLSELVFHRPGGRLRDAEPTPQLDAGDSLLRLGHQIHGFEPEPQRQLAGCENSPRLHRGLLAAGVALESGARRA